MGKVNFLSCKEKCLVVMSQGDFYCSLIYIFQDFVKYYVFKNLIIEVSDTVGCDLVCFFCGVFVMYVYLFFRCI